MSISFLSLKSSLSAMWQMPIVALNGGLAEWLPLKSIQDFFNIVDYKMYTSIVYIFYNKRYIYTIFMYMVYRTHDPILKEFRESNFPFEWVWVTHCQINIEEKKFQYYIL